MRARFGKTTVLSLVVLSLLAVCAGCGRQLTASPTTTPTAAAVDTPTVEPTGTPTGTQTVEPTTVVASPTIAPTIAPTDAVDGVEWLVEPTLEYDTIFYDFECGYTAIYPDDTYMVIDSKTGLPLREHLGHGGGGASSVVYFDEEQQRYYASNDDTGEIVHRATLDELAKAWALDPLFGVLLARWNDEGYVVTIFDADDNYTAGIASLDGVWTGLIYQDIDEHLSNPAAVKKDGKWGFIDVSNNAEVLPFVFDDAVSIDESSAFVKVNGKYGIVKKPKC